MERDQFNKWFKAEFAAQMRAMTPAPYDKSQPTNLTQEQAISWLGRLLPWAQEEVWRRRFDLKVAVREVGWNKPSDDSEVICPKRPRTRSGNT